MRRPLSLRPTLRGGAPAHRYLATLLLLTAATALGIADPAGAAVTDLGAGIVPFAVNSKRVVVGDSTDPANDEAPSHAVVWKAGTLTRLPEPAGTTNSDAVGINASGRIVGSVKVGGDVHAVYWDPPYSAQPVQAGPIGTVTAGGDYSLGEGIDAAGDIVGRTVDATDPHSWKPTAFVLASGTLTKVGTADAADGVPQAHAISGDGTKILGELNGATGANESHNGWYLWPSAGGGGTKLTIKPFHGPSAGFVNGVAVLTYGNTLASDGALLGYTGSPNDGTDAWFLRTPAGTLTPINGLAGHNAINARHLVAGTTITGTDLTTLRGAIWKPDGTVTTLQSQQPGATDWILYDAIALSDNNDVVGLGAKSGAQHGFLIAGGYVVDSNGDQPDATIGDGACLTATNTCTLRAALQEVSASTGGANADPISITFNLASASTTISPGSALPAASKPVAIDATTNPGGFVTIDAASAGDANGLVLQGNGSTVRGLKITHAHRAGLRLEAAHARIGNVSGVASPCTFPCNQFVSNTGPAVAIAAGAANTDNAIRGNRMTGNARPAIDLGADGRTPDDKADADAGANGLHNFPIGVLAEADPVTGKTQISGTVSAADAGQSVDIYAQSTVAAARGAEPDLYVGTTTVTVTGGFILQRPTTLPSADRFFSATVTDATDGTSELSPICGDPDGDGNPDSDGDGLCDDWETSGLDADDDGTVDLPLNSPAYGASPTHKDLFLELDAMKKPAGGNYGPSQGAIDDVVAAFAKAPVTNTTGGDGVALHVNPGGGPVDDADLPDQPAIKAAGRGQGTIEYVRNADPNVPCDGSFGTAAERASANCAAILAARGLAFRWGLFGSNYAEWPGSSGIALGLGAQSFAVTVGGWTDASIIASGGGLSECHALEECRRSVQAGTLMHEFGHTLGLHHGGRDDLNRKPNYLSVMSYLYQMRGRDQLRPLDYSRFALPTLDELHLVDADGVGGNLDPATKAAISAEWPLVVFDLYTPSTHTCTLYSGPLGTPTDWDFNGTTPVSVALLHDQCASGATVLTSTKDWPDLRYSFRDQPGVLEVPSAGDSASPTPAEETGTDIERDLANADTDRNGVNDLADRCRITAGTDLVDANGNGFADVCEPTLEQFHALPGQSNGAGTPAPGASATPGGSSGPAADRTPPTISVLKAKPSTATRAKGKAKAKPAKLAFSLSEAGTVSITAERATKGHKQGKTCSTKAHAKGASCTKYAALSGTLRIDGKVGANAVSFTGQLGTKKLAAGSYRLSVVAVDAAGNRSAPATVAVTVR